MDERRILRENKQTNDVATIAFLYIDDNDFVRNKITCISASQIQSILPTI